MLCDDAHDNRTVLFKIDLKGHQLVPFMTFPVGKCGKNFSWNAPLGGPVDLAGQSYRPAFSRDLQKLAVNMENAYNLGNHVGYYDAQTGRDVDVTAVTTPPTTDFSTNPRQSGGSFTDDGLFMFHDDIADTYKYFDTAGQKIVKETKDPELPKFLAQTGVPDLTAPGSGIAFRTCNLVWDIDGARYLGYVNSNVVGDQHYGFLGLDTIPPATDREQCGNVENPGSAQKLAPNSIVFGGITDPAGSTILFTISGSDSTEKLYQANRSNPDQPTKIDLQTPPINNFELLHMVFLEWS